MVLWPCQRRGLSVFLVCTEQSRAGDHGDHERSRGSMRLGFWLFLAISGCRWQRGLAAWTGPASSRQPARQAWLLARLSKTEQDNKHTIGKHEKLQRMIQPGVLWVEPAQRERNSGSSLYSTMFSRAERRAKGLGLTRQVGRSLKAPSKGRTSSFAKVSEAPVYLSASY